MNHSRLFKYVTSTSKNLPLPEGFKLTVFGYQGKFNYNYIITVQLQDHVPYMRIMQKITQTQLVLSTHFLFSIFCPPKVLIHLRWLNSLEIKCLLTRRCFRMKYRIMGLPRCTLGGVRTARQCRRCKRCVFNPWARKIPLSKNGNPIQCSCLENSMGAQQATVYGATESQT